MERERIENLTYPVLLTKLTPLCAVGDQFHERKDQEACLDILKRTEKDHARPTEAVQQQMMRSWDMTEEQMRS